ncbi:MAG: RsmE family RNA methyltransferase [Chloroherpetonaceae bacterium]|nr:RsmE family RNA methyltransferase [Chloroherpetonaceae bacterium]
MELFYAPPAQINLEANSLSLSEQEFLHATKVLRYKIGDVIHCIDGLGTRYDATIETIEKEFLTAKILSRETEAEPKTRVSVAISLTKTHDRFENFLEKATELGVSEILPMISERTISRPDERGRENKNERWEKIILAACKQSQRYRLPILHPIQRFADVMKRNDKLKLIPYELSTKQGLPSMLCESVLFVIGPEGGFTVEEVIIAKTCGFKEISFGKTILRVDTAGVFAVSLVRAEELRQVAY